MQNPAFHNIISVPVGLFTPPVRKGSSCEKKQESYLVNGRPCKASARKVWGDTGIADAVEPFSL